MILTSPSVSLAYDIVWSDIWGDMVKMIRGEQCTDRDQMFLCLKIWHSEGEAQDFNNELVQADSIKKS